jgi:hypothetical protein
MKTLGLSVAWVLPWVLGVVGRGMSQHVIWHFPHSKPSPRMDGRMDGWMNGRTDGRMNNYIYCTYCLYNYNICDWHWTEHIYKRHTCPCACLTYMQTFFKHNQTMEWHPTSAQEWLDSEVPAHPCCTEPRQSILIHLTIRVRTPLVASSAAHRGWSIQSNGAIWSTTAMHVSRFQSTRILMDLEVWEIWKPTPNYHATEVRWLTWPPQMKHSHPSQLVPNWHVEVSILLPSLKSLKEPPALPIYVGSISKSSSIFFRCVSRCFPTSASPASTSSSSFSPQLG